MMKIEEIENNFNLFKAFKPDRNESLKWEMVSYKYFRDREDLDYDAYCANVELMYKRVDEKLDENKAVWFMFSGYKLERVG